LKIYSVEPFAFVHTPQKFPKERYRHFVFAGRSNVGKSSLINCLLNRKLVARVSKAPGKTISVNYYLINGSFFLVDLPGYGFALDRKQKRGTWDKLIDSYFLENSKSLTLYHLIDSRIGPTELDMQMESYCEKFDFSRIILITKSDKLRKTELTKSLEGIKELLKDFNISDFILFSSKAKLGRKEVLRSINEKICK